jgi:hypothetical protein
MWILPGNLFRKDKIILALALVTPILAIIGLVCLQIPLLLNQIPSICIIKNIFGVECPGCGMMRALSHLINGNINQSIELNWKAVVIGPLLVGIYLNWVFTVVRGNRKHSSALRNLYRN